MILASAFLETACSRSPSSERFKVLKRTWLEIRLIQSAQSNPQQQREGSVDKCTIWAALQEWMVTDRAKVAGILRVAGEACSQMED